MGIPEAPTKPNDFDIHTLPKLIRKKADEYGDDVLITENATGETLTFEEADRKSDDVAASLDDAGVEEGDVVATLMTNSIHHVLLMLGSFKRGAIFSAVNAEFKNEDLRNALDDIEPELFALDAVMLENYESVRGDVPIGTEYIRYGTLDGARPFDELLESSAEPPDVTIKPSDPAVILFTGGTTGRPKPVLNPQFGLIAGAHRFDQTFEPGEDDVYLTLGQMFHVAGQQYGVLGPMLTGTPSVLAMRFSASEYWDWVNTHEATIIDAAGDIQDALLDAHDEPVENTARRSLAASAPAATNERFAERFGIDELVEAWSMTELGGVNVTSTPPFDPSEVKGKKGKPVGTAEPWAEIAIMDEQGGQLPAGPENVGEIHLRPNVSHMFMKRYYNYPEKTVEAFEDLWLATGDFGYLDEENVLHFTGRGVDHLRRFGENFSAQEVESILNQHPDVAASCIVGVPNETISGDDAKAYVVVSAGASPEPGELVAWCDERLADFKVPRYIEFIDELPRGESKQQIKRNQLADRGIRGAWDSQAEN